MLVKAISDNNLQALARAILLYIPKEVGTYYDIACKQRSDNDGQYSNHSFSTICLTGSINRSISPAPSINTTSHAGASFSAKARSSSL